MKKVLFFQQHPDDEASALELQLAHWLKSQGAQCLHVVCGTRDFRVCDRFAVDVDPGVRASACSSPCFQKNYQERKQLELATTTLGDMTAPGVIGTANAWFFSSTGKDLRNENFEGIPLFPFVLSSLARSVQAWESLDPNGVDRYVCSEWMRYAIQLFAAALEACERFHPDILVAGEGKLLSSRVAIAVAKQMEIPFLSVAHCPGEDRFRMGLQRAALPVALGSVAPDGTLQRLRADERAQLTPYLARPQKRSGPKTAVLLSGIPWSLDAVRQRGLFPRQIDWIQTVVATLQRHEDWRLILDPHPQDPGWNGPARESPLQEMRSIPFSKDRVSIAPDASRRSWQNADLVLDYGTDEGLLAAASGIPVITLHEPAWSSWGVGCSPVTREQFESELENRLRLPIVSENEVEIALAIAHDYFFQSVGFKNCPEDFARVAEIALSLASPLAAGAATA